MCPFLFCNHLDEKKRAGWFAFIVLRMSCYCRCSVALLTVPWVGLQCVIVVFPDPHTTYCLINLVCLPVACIDGFRHCHSITIWSDHYNKGLFEPTTETVLSFILWFQYIACNLGKMLCNQSQKNSVMWKISTGQTCSFLVWFWTIAFRTKNIYLDSFT